MGVEPRAAKAERRTLVPGAELEARTWAEVDAWLNDQSWAQAKGQPRPTLVYRGARRKRRLENGLLRRGEAYARREPHIMSAFRRYAYRSGRPDWSDWEWLALAQHHGLPTRLLDFTFSPLIALHFATLSYDDEPAMVWAVDYGRVCEYIPPKLKKILEHAESKLFSTEQLAGVAPTLGEFDELADGEAFAVFWEPPSIEERIVNQSAVFGVMSDPAARFDDWLEAHADTRHILQLTPQARQETRRHLDLVGITERLLFPDLTGLAAWIARYYG